MYQTNKYYPTVFDNQYPSIGTPIIGQSRGTYAPVSYQVKKITDYSGMDSNGASSVNLAIKPFPKTRHT